MGDFFFSWASCDCFPFSWNIVGAGCRYSTHALVLPKALACLRVSFARDC